jgi:uncharacterized protein YmfQ (DUF2313 family)
MTCFIDSESVEGLQVMLDALYNYTEKWTLSVNINKTKIVVFRNGGILSDDEKWYYNGFIKIHNNLSEYSYWHLIISTKT